MSVWLPSKPIWPSSDFDNETVKSDFEELYRLTNGKSLKEIDEIIYAGFVEGIKCGVKQITEITKS